MVLKAAKGHGEIRNPEEPIRRVRRVGTVPAIGTHEQPILRAPSGWLSRRLSTYALSAEDAGTADVHIMPVPVQMGRRPV